MASELLSPFLSLSLCMFAGLCLSVCVCLSLSIHPDQVMGSRSRYTEQFVEFLQQCPANTRVTFDQWSSFLEFSNTVKDDFQGYDEEGACESCHRGLWTLAVGSHAGENCKTYLRMILPGAYPVYFDDCTGPLRLWAWCSLSRVKKYFFCV